MAVLSLFILGLLLFPARVLAQPVPTVRLTFGKNFFSPSESFTSTGTIINSTTESIKYSQVTMTVYDKIKETDPVFNAPSAKSKIILSQRWFKTLPPGATELTLTRNLDDLKLREGVYPAELRLTLAAKQTFVDRSFLVVLDSRPDPLPVVLIWNLHLPEQRLPDGVFKDDGLAAAVDDNPQSAGHLARHLIVLSEHPLVKANLAISPSLIEQLSAISGGYAHRQNGQTIKETPESRQSQVAKAWLEHAGDLKKSGQAEILTSPYGQAPLPVLAGLGWNEDALDQLKLAADTLEKAKLSSAPMGLILPRLLVDRQSADWAGEAGFDYLIAAPPEAHANFGGRSPVTVRGGRSPVIFPADQEISDWLSMTSPEKSGQELTALLAHRLLAGQNQGAVFVAPSVPNWSPSSETLRPIYQALADAPWIKTTLLSEALQLRPRRIKLKRSLNPPANKQYLSALTAARDIFRDFSSGVAKNNQLRRRLERQLFAAEAVDYLIEPNPPENDLGRLYLNDIATTIKAEFSKLELVPPPKITFSTRSGKVPVAINNQTGYPIKARLSFSGQDFLFSDDTSEEVVLMPKENLVSRNITAGFVGLSKLNVKIAVGDREIAERQIEVRVSSLLRYVVVGATILFVSGLATLVLLRGRKR